MALSSLGDLAQSFVLQRQNTALKVQIQRLSEEAVSGTALDTAAQVAGDFQPLVGIDASLARLSGYRTATAEAALFSGAMQTVLTLVDSVASTLSTTLLAASSTISADRVNAMGIQARQSLDSTVSAFNTRLGDRTLFAGQASNGAALLDADQMMTAIEAAVEGATTAAGVEQAVTDWFRSPTGFGAAYLGGAALADLRIAPGDSASLDITARDPAVRDTLRGMAMAALLDRGVLASDPGARSDLAARAASQLRDAAEDRTYLASRLGSVEAQIEDAKVRNAAETSALELARVEIVAVDPYETATRLEAAQTQLETLYALTARMTRMTLVDYL